MDKIAHRKRRQDKLQRKSNNVKYKQLEDKSVQKKQVEGALPSNWTKYEILESSDEDTLNTANFQTLLDERVAQQSYFQFKNEQNWSDSVELHSQFSKYFTVDLKLLSEGIICVPFTKRQDFDERLFTSAALLNIHKEANLHLQKYQTFLNKKSSQNALVCDVNVHQQVIQKVASILNRMPIDQKGINIGDSKGKIYLEKNVSSMHRTKNVDVDDEDIDSLIHLNISDQTISNDTNDTDFAGDPLLETKPSVKSVTIRNTERDLEQWLDDILDD